MIDVPAQSSLAPLLVPASWIYGAVVSLRNAMFDLGLLRAHRVGAPVISVGNLTVGGTGKTPVVEMVASLLTGAGRKPAIVSRGYGRRSKGQVLVSAGAGPLCGAAEGGDEPVQLAGRLRGAIVIADEDRVRGARSALDNHGADCIVLDDGFQHRRIARDLDIVVISGGQAPDTLRLLPAGPLREPASGIRRAGMVVFNTGPSSAGSTATAASPNPGDSLGNPAGIPSVIPWAIMQYEIASVVHMDGREESAGWLSGREVVAFCGIGNPESFRTLLERSGAKIARFLPFPDHRWFTAADHDRIGGAAAAVPGAPVLTTEKDAVRLPSGGPVASVAAGTAWAERLHTVRIRPVISAGESRFREIVLAAAGQGATRIK